MRELVRRALATLARPRHHAWIVLVLAILVLLPGLGSHGFWEPREIAVAEAAKKWLAEKDSARTAGGAEPAAAPEERAGSGEVEDEEPAPAVQSPQPGISPEPGAAADPDEQAEPGISPEPGAAADPDEQAEPGISPEPGAAADPDEQVDPHEHAEPEEHADPAEGDEAAPPAQAGRARPGEQSAASSSTSAARARPRPARPPIKRRVDEPRFTERLIAHGVERAGFTELGARWPLALLGLIAVMAAYLLGARLSSPRAGLIGAIALLSTPYLILQSRQLTSEIGALTGSALLALGLVGLALPDRWRALTGRTGSASADAGDEPSSARRLAGSAGLLLAVDAALVAAGLVLCNLSAGLLLGVLPPLAGVGVGALAWALADRPGRPRPGHGPILVVGALSLAGAGIALVLFMEDTFRWLEPGQAGIGDGFLDRMVPVKEKLPALGATWKASGDVQVPFSAVLEQLGFGMFPWMALAPLAVVGLALAARQPAAAASPDASAAAVRAPWGGAVLFAWAAVAWLVASILARKVGPVLYPAAVAVAVAVGVWLDRLLARRTAAREEEASSLPLVALFALLAALVLARNLMSAPEVLTSLTSLDGKVKYPEGSKLHLAVAGFGVLFGLAAAAGLFFWRGPYRPRWRPLAVVVDHAGRHGLHAAVAVALGFALFLSHVWLPGLSARMSSRDVLGAYRELRQEGDVLGLLGNLGSGPTYYAGSDYEKLGNRSELIEFLQRPGRVFALTRSNELCPLYKESSKRGFRFHVLDRSHVQYFLLSNQLRPGEKDENPLIDAVRRTPPERIDHPMSVNFEDQIELVGVNMPRRVSRGSEFEMVLIYKILKPVTRPWKIFVHIDGPARIGADHSPAGGHCAMSYFQPGDYVIDRHTVVAGDMTHPKTTYRVWTGFFVGSGGNFTNMKVKSGGKPDRDHRVPIGSIEIH